MGAFGNSLKTFILIALLTALLLWVGQMLGGTTGLIFALFIVLIMNLVSFWYSDKIVLRMYRAQELPASHHVAKFVKHLTQQMELPMPRVYLIPGPTPNAFATGRSPKKAAVAVTEGILNLLDDRELKGVLAHELSHVKNRDTLIQTIAAIIAGVISYIATMAQWAAIFGGFGSDDDGGSIISLLVLAIVTPIAALVLQMALSRTREYMADAGAARALNDGQGLANALQKLEHGNAVRPMRRGNPSTAPLFIINPFRGSFLHEMLSTHPSTDKRVAALEKLGY